jgi:hypothetical protein
VTLPPNPASVFQLPSSGFRLPASVFRLPSSGFRLPASGFRLPASGLLKECKTIFNFIRNKYFILIFYKIPFGWILDMLDVYLCGFLFVTIKIKTPGG